LSVTEEQSAVPADSVAFDRAWRLHPKVSLRDESFGALAYHYDTRRLVFLKSRPLVKLVASLEHYESADAALEDLIAPDERPRYRQALARLARSQVIDVA